MKDTNEILDKSNIIKNARTLATLYITKQLFANKEENAIFAFINYIKNKKEIYIYTKNVFM